MKNLLLGLFLSSVAVAATSYAELPSAKGWIAGKDYLASWDSQKLNVEKSVAPASHAFDAKGCVLWVADPQQKTLQKFEAHGLTPVLSLDAKGRLLSPLNEAGFLFANDATGKVERRNADGEVKANYDVADLEFLVAAAGIDTTWALFFDSKQNRIWIKSLDEELKVKKEIPVAVSKVIWANPRLLVNEKNSEAWVGYSSSAPGFSYSPHVNQYGADGALKNEYRWKLRGLFFDFCQTGDRVFAAHDLPTPPYTVPVTSYVEELLADKGVTPLYTAATNDFVDSLTCQGPSLWMAQRSIFGSQGSYLMHWQKGDKGTGRLVHKLPGSVEKLYLCD